MASVNKATLIGNLGRDPETRYLPNGDAVTNFSIATTETWKDKAGEKQESTQWHRLTAYRRLAEVCGEYLKKGSQVYIEGRIEYREYEKDGVKKYSTDIIVNSMVMLGPRPEGAGDGGDHEEGARTVNRSSSAKKSASEASDAYAAASGKAPGKRKAADDFDDDIPF